MFLYYYALADIPLATVEQRLLERLDRLEAWAGEAYRTGEQLAEGVTVGAGMLSKQVRLRVWPVTSAPTVTVLRLAWEATGVPGLFPRLDADLVLAALGSGLTQVALRGSYEPPLGKVGTVLDRVLLHRVAEASVKQFVDRIVTEVAVRPAENAAR